MQNIFLKILMYQVFITPHCIKLSQYYFVHYICLTQTFFFFVYQYEKYFLIKKLDFYLINLYKNFDTYEIGELNEIRGKCSTDT